MIQSARKIVPGAFVLDATRCQPSIATVSHGRIECLAYDYPSWHQGGPQYVGDFELIKPGDALILLSEQRAPVSARVSQILEDADDDGEPVRILLGDRLGT